jgi:hypothetical protein
MLPSASSPASSSRPYKASTLFLNSFFSYTAPISPANTHDTAT